MNSFKDISIIFNNGWLFFILATIINAFILKYQSKKYIAQNPELKKGYDNYFKGILFFGNIPWIIMMIGNLTGKTHSMLEYLNPSAMNPMVLIFHFSIIALWILTIWWIYYNKGAEFIEAHPGLLRKSSFGSSTNPTAKQIKIFLPLAIAGGVIGMIIMWAVKLPPELIELIGR